jgi:hypothetical protein
MISSPRSSHMGSRRPCIARGRAVFAAMALVALASNAQSSADDPSAGDFAQFNDLDGAFVIENGEARRSQHEGVYTEDRHYLTSARSDYLATDWTYEVKIRSPRNGPPDILFIGMGSGRPDPTFYNEPGNVVEFRIHQGWIDGRVDVTAHPTGPEWTYAAEAIGYLPARGDTEFTELTARITKVGNTITFDICDCSPTSDPCQRIYSNTIPDLAAVAPFLSVGNTYLFVGNGSGSYVYTKATITPASTEDVAPPASRAEGVADSGDSADALSRRGAGAVDGVLLTLLALFAIGRVLRPRRTPGR